MESDLGDDVIESLTLKGLIERFVRGNKEYFQLTELGKIVVEHLDADPACKN